MTHGGESVTGALGEAGLPLEVRAPGLRARTESPVREAIRRLRGSRTAVVGAAIVVALVVVALGADVLAPQSPIASDQSGVRMAASRQSNRRREDLQATLC